MSRYLPFPDYDSIRLESLSSQGHAPLSPFQQNATTSAAEIDQRASALLEMSWIESHSATQWRFARVVATRNFVMLRL